MSSNTRGREKPVGPLPSVRNRSLWESYKVLPARSRVYVSMALCTVGAAGVFVSDYLEKWFPAERPGCV
ncbi:hypothetical protein PAXRUDRAFT_150208 [Paxillus rubicundulus Ve08.2h10]|uniref:Uncharacterized protein n=1 Tax=Paxillus rubicundulus Ve08.2h10 TaxID=930991 RepID=A0A0D0DXK3_9AGAM|nr:hypothetical protein PAXRUDRAFT_150208 [Paxillus rubicundulus Ve08.2h10]